MAGFLARIVGGLLRDRTLQAGTGITITNPAGDAGDPTISATNTNTGTVTNTTGALTLNQVVLGNGGSDIKSLGSAGTATQVLHGAAPPTFSAVALASDVSGTLADSHLSANVALDNIDNHMVAQSFATGCVVLAVNDPALYWNDSGNAANQHYFRIYETNGAGVLAIQPLDDTLVPQGTLTIDRTANITNFGGQIIFPTTQNPSANVNALDDYEEGGWTPTDTSGAGLAFTSVVAFYIKVGRKVTVTGILVYPATASGLAAKIGNLPFTAQISQPAGGGNSPFNTCGFRVDIYVRENTANIELFTTSGVAVTNTQMSTQSIDFVATYFANA